MDRTRQRRSLQTDPPPPVRWVAVTIGRPLPNGNLAVHFESLNTLGRYPYCDEGIEPGRLPAALRVEGSLAFLLLNNRQELVGIREREPRV